MGYMIKNDIPYAGSPSNFTLNEASAYNPSTTYPVGSYCIYQNVLRKCTGETSGAFDASKWEVTKIGDEISSLSEAIATKYGNPKYANIDITLFQHGGTIPTTGMLVVCFAITGNCDCTVHIANSSVARIRWQSGAVNSFIMPLTIPVIKGQSFTLSDRTNISVANCYIIPMY